MRKKIVFIVTEPLDPVVFSQVLLLSEQVKKNGLDVAVVFLLQTQAYKTYKADITKLRQYKTVESVFFCPYQNRFIGRAFALACLLKVRLVNWKASLIFHCRGDRAAQFGNDFKDLLKANVATVADFRGDLVAEVKNNTPLIERILKTEPRLLTHSDGCLFVSNHLKQVIETRSGYVQGKSAVFYCAADEEKFAFNTQERHRIRKKHDLGDSPVVIYSGSIGRWHCFDKVLALSLLLVTLNKNSKFVFLVNDPQNAQKELANENYAQLRDHVTLLNVKPNEVSAYLSAGDVALLLRRPDPINASASPVKFAEYALSGLKIVMSAAIADYAKLTASQDLGWVVNDLSEDELKRVAIDIDHFFKTLIERNKVDDNLKPLSKNYHAEHLCYFYNDL